MRSLNLLGAICCALILTVLCGASDKKSKDAPLQASNVRFTVVKDDNNKPVRNASVVLHPVDKNGGQSKGGFQIKTDSEGKVLYEGLPYGLLRVQVLAPGMKTFGDDYDINKPEMEIEIRLKRPSDQYSTYDNKPAEQATPQSTPPADNKPH
jgi:hypothetical protein